MGWAPVFPLPALKEYAKVPSYIPSLYSIFVDELLDILYASGYGVKVGEVYCGAPMYADDLALIAESPDELQAMLNIVSRYALRWRYQLNPEKSIIMVFWESNRTRSSA